MGGEIPSENVESQTFSLSGVNATRACTFSNKIRLLIACRSGDSTYSIYKVNEDGTSVLLRYGSGSLSVTFSTDLKTATVKSSWSSSAVYFVIALTADDLNAVEYTAN